MLDMLLLEALLMMIPVMLLDVFLMRTRSLKALLWSDGSLRVIQFLMKPASNWSMFLLRTQLPVINLMLLNVFLKRTR